MVFDICGYIYWNENKQYSFEDYNLILPDVSVGNVGQLAIDLLLNNLTTEHLGRVVHPCFMPFIGEDPFEPGSNRLASSCEIYECKEKKLIILQIRSCVFPGKFSEFKDLIISFMKKFNFSQTIVVASSFSEYFAAEQLQDVPLHYLSTSTFSHAEALNQLKWKRFSLPKNVNSTETSRIPGTFLSYPLLETCEKEKLRVVVLICVCSEGNNYPEAFRVIKSMNSWLTLKQPKGSEEIWKKPVSWKLPYGNAPPGIMF